MFQLIQHITEQLQPMYTEREARALARHLLEVRFGISQMDLCLGKVKHFSTEERHEIENIIQKLLQNEPIQYILQQADFCGHPFFVTHDVLIPRPETEELVDWITRNVNEKKSYSPNILDIGTGSGCIAISLAKALPDAHVTAYDISDSALLVASKNAKNLQADVNFRQIDILKEKNSTTLQDKWDIIVSNPPYICLSEKDEMEENVLAYEPHLALFVPNESPLLFYQAIAEYASKCLQNNGELYFEINRRFGDEVCQLLGDHGFSDVTLRKDIYNNDRMIKCTWKNQ